MENKIVLLSSGIWVRYLYSADTAFTFGLFWGRTAEGETRLFHEAEIITQNNDR